MPFLWFGRVLSLCPWPPEPSLFKHRGPLLAVLSIAVCGLGKFSIRNPPARTPWWLLEMSPRGTVSVGCEGFTVYLPSIFQTSCVFTTLREGCIWGATQTSGPSVSRLFSVTHLLTSACSGLSSSRLVSADEACSHSVTEGESAFPFP